MATETNVQIEVPRTGQKIRNLQVSAVQSDGTVATVLMQVVTLADDQGNILQLDALRSDVLGELLEVSKQQRTLLMFLTNGLLKASISEKDLETA